MNRCLVLFGSYTIILIDIFRISIKYIYNKLSFINNTSSFPDQYDSDRESMVGLGKEMEDSIQFWSKELWNLRLIVLGPKCLSTQKSFK